MNKKRPYQVTSKSGSTKLIVMDAKDGLPAAFALMGTRAKKKVAIRITGGCKGMSEDDKDQMLEFFKKAFAGFKGLVWSGGTRMVNDNGEIDPMITDVPGVVARLNNGSVALGTAPRTDIMSLQEDSRLVFDEWGTAPNPDMSGILIVQNGPDGSIGWSGDLDAYFSLMDNWKNYAGFEVLGLCSWNGGDITKDEVMRSIKKGWPTILIEGSGRVTDEIIQLYKNEDKVFMSSIPENHKIFIANRNDSKTLRQILSDQTFI